MESRRVLKGLRRRSEWAPFPGLGVPDEILLPLGLRPTRLPFSISRGEPSPTTHHTEAGHPLASQGKGYPSSPTPPSLGLQVKCCQNILLYFDDPSQWPAVYKAGDKVKSVRKVEGRGEKVEAGQGVTASLPSPRTAWPRSQ